MNSFFTPASKSTSTPSKSQNILNLDFDDGADVDVSDFDEEPKNPDRDCCVVFCFLYGLWAIMFDVCTMNDDEVNLKKEVNSSIINAIVIFLADCDYRTLPFYLFSLYGRLSMGTLKQKGIVTCILVEAAPGKNVQRSNHVAQYRHGALKGG